MLFTMRIVIDFETKKVEDYPWVETQVNSALGHINVNKGPKRVTDALIGLIDKSEGRIVNISSGSASMWLRYQDSTTQKLFTNPDISFEDLEAKGGLISEKISLWLKSPQNGAQITSHDPEHLLSK